MLMIYRMFKNKSILFNILNFFSEELTQYRSFVSMFYDKNNYSNLKHQTK